MANLRNNEVLPHSLFEKISPPVVRTLGCRKFKFMHGHEVDPFIRKRSKTICQVFSPVVEMLQSSSDSTALAYDICSDFALELSEAALAIWKWLFELTKYAADDCLAVLPNEEQALLKRHGRTKKMLRRYREDLHEGLYDAAVVGHTHKAGRFSDWYFNSGSWTAHRSNFLCISPDGDVELFNWCTSGPLLNSEFVISER